MKKPPKDMPTNKTPAIKPGYKTTYHRDGSVSYWSVALQRWQRTSAYALTNRHEDYAALSDSERARVSRTATQ
jgi:hypothetical protein